MRIVGITSDSLWAPINPCCLSTSFWLPYLIFLGLFKIRPSQKVKKNLNQKNRIRVFPAINVSRAAVRWRRRRGREPPEAAILADTVWEIANRRASISGSSSFLRHRLTKFPISLSL